MKTIIFFIVIYFLFSLLMKKKPKNADQTKPAPPSLRSLIAAEEPDNSAVPPLLQPRAPLTPWPEPARPVEPATEPVRTFLSAPAAATEESRPKTDDFMSLLLGTPKPPAPEPEPPLVSVDTPAPEPAMLSAEAILAVADQYIAAEPLYPAGVKTGQPALPVRRRIRRLTPVAAREGIILAEILGPCLANRPPGELNGR
jgi:hypothetical protein